MLLVVGSIQSRKSPFKGIRHGDPVLLKYHQAARQPGTEGKDQNLEQYHQQVADWAKYRYTSLPFDGIVALMGVPIL
jgi:hypothetical protein